MKYDYAWEMTPAGLGPQRRKHHVVVGSGADRIRIRLLSARMPELEKTKR
jgi:hypothetical protein